VGTTLLCGKKNRHPRPSGWELNILIVSPTKPSRRASGDGPFRGHKSLTGEFFMFPRAHEIALNIHIFCITGALSLVVRLRAKKPVRVFSGGDP
jgi:hypothetical protein